MIEYFIKRPNRKSGTKNYTLVRRLTHPNGTRSHETIKNETVDALNKQLRDKVLAPDFVEEQLRAMIRKFKGEEGIPAPELFHNPENVKLLKRFWSDVYEHRRLEDRDSAYNDYRRAVEALGKVSLISADARELEKAINTQFKGRKQRRIISKIQIIKKYLGQPVKLTLDKKSRLIIRHLTLKEFKKVLDFISDPNKKLLYKAAFFCGARDGELFALKSEDFRGKSVYIDKQLTQELIIKDPKWGSIREAFIPNVGRAAVKAWCALAPEIKTEMRKIQHRHSLKKACRKLFPGQTDKHCTIHDLRHSYAIFLLSHDMTLERVAKFIGDSIKTTEEYYTGKRSTNDDVLVADKLFRKR